MRQFSNEYYSMEKYNKTLETAMKLHPVVKNYKNELSSWTCTSEVL